MLKVLARDVSKRIPKSQEDNYLSIMSKQLFGQRISSKDKDLRLVKRDNSLRL